MSEGASHQVFVSHAGPDTGWAEWLAWQLRAEGHSVELDAWDWQAGESFVARMRAAMQVPGVVMVALLSDAYFEPGRFSVVEWDAARAAAQAGGLRIVPVRVTPVMPPILDGPIIYVDLFGVDSATARARLLAGVRGKRAPEREPDFPGIAAGGRGPSAEPRLPGVMPSVWRMPPRNPAFTGRDQVLSELRASLDNGGGRVAVRVLCGMGGVGKTSLAIEYAHRFNADFDAVWRLDAAVPTLIGDQLAEFAVAANVAAPDADVKTAAAAAAAWLRQERGWLLVFDNAEDPRPVLPWLPEGRGQVLVTSRDGRWAWHATGASAQRVDVFARAESLNLVRILVPSTSDEDAGRVAEALGDLPLGLAQAGGFMAETGMSAAEYVVELERRAGELMAEGIAAGYAHSLAAAVRTSLDRVLADDPAAGQMLAVAAFLAPEPIPARWFTAISSMLPEPLASTAASTLVLRRTLGRLARYGLVRLSGEHPEIGNLLLHRLVAAIISDTVRHDYGAVVRVDACRESAIAAARRQAESMVVAAAPSDTEDPSTWPDWRLLTVHLPPLHPETSVNDSLRRVAINAVRVQLVRGDRAGWAAAQRLYDGWLTTLGRDHPDTLMAAQRLGQALHEAGRNLEARSLAEDTLARRRCVLGDDHADTLNSANNLANALSVLGDVAAGRALDEDILGRRRRVLGEDHPDTLMSANNLAIDLRELGDVRAARDLNEDTLARRRRVLGEDHPYTLHTAENLAADLRELGEVAAARDLDDDTLARRRRVLGEDHPDTLRSVKNLAVDLREQERQTSD